MLLDLRKEGCDQQCITLVGMGCERQISFSSRESFFAGSPSYQGLSNYGGSKECPLVENRKHRYDKKIRAREDYLSTGVYLAWRNSVNKQNFLQNQMKVYLVLALKNFPLASRIMMSWDWIPLIIGMIVTNASGCW
jgi:hypothetical protein